MSSNGLLEGAIKFHGHLGPFLVLGLKAGLAGVAYLGKDCFKTTAKVKTAAHPPRSCFIDGVQFASGCTMGKGNIHAQVSDDVSVEFTLGERRITLTVKNEVLKALEGISSTDESERISREFMGKADAELFQINKN